MALAKVGLIGLMVVGSLMLWIGIPVGWLWIGSQVASESQQTSLGTYMLVLIAIVASMIADGEGAVEAQPGLRAGHRRGPHSAGPDAVAPQHARRDGLAAAAPDPGRGDGRQRGHRARRLALWFALFAGSPLPG